MKTFLRLIVYFICAVCLYDIYCTVNFNEHLYYAELNPIARLLITQEKIKVIYSVPEGIKFDHDVFIVTTNVSKLVLFKVIGLIGAIKIFDWLIDSKHNKVTQTVIFSMFIIQFLLLLYLTLV